MRDSRRRILCYVYYVDTKRTARLPDSLGGHALGRLFGGLHQTTAVFAKVDVTFGDDLTGVGGMRVNW